MSKTSKDFNHKKKLLVYFCLIYIFIHIFLRSFERICRDRVREKERKDDETKSNLANQIDKPNTETIAYMDLFSQLKIRANKTKEFLSCSYRTVHEPSVVLSQKHELAVCKPAPFFCIITQETMYLNGLFNFVNELRIASTIFDVQVLIFAC